jgi:uncharacterized alkaline shock family protein YloU
MSQVREGAVFVAPGVLAAIAGLTALSVEGVSRMSPRQPTSMWRLIGRDGAGQGVKVRQEGDAIGVEVNVIMRRDAHVVQVAREIQGRVAEAILQLVGVMVHEVDVFVRGVD